MKIDVLTLFPNMFVGPLDESIVQRAREAGLLDLKIHNLRDYTHDRHKTVDDRPFGGGPGMLLKPEPIFEALDLLAAEETWVVLLSPVGRLFTRRWPVNWPSVPSAVHLRQLRGCGRTGTRSFGR